MNYKDVVGYALVVALAVGLWLWLRGTGYRPENPMQGALFTPPGLAIALFLGFMGLRGLRDLNLPGIFNANRPLLLQVVLPVAIGAAFAAWGVLNSRLAPATGVAPMARVALPTGLPYYALGNMLTEVLFRLGLFTLFVSLGRQFFPNASIVLPIAVVAIVEFLSAVSGLAASGGKMTLVSMLLSVAFFAALSVTQSVSLVELGFIAPMIARITLGLIGEVLVPMLTR